MNVTGYDNRGTTEVPFGFVYFDDGRRVVYTSDGVSNGTGGWDPITPAHNAAAAAYLHRHGVI
jgi:hypothetical protein